MHYGQLENSQLLSRRLAFEGIKIRYNHSNKPMRIGRNFRIQIIDGTLIPTADMTKIEYNGIKD